MHKNVINLLGQRFGKLLVVKYIKSIKNKTIWECQCDCGKVIQTSSKSLIYGGSKSCGCMRFGGRWLQKGDKSPSWKGYGEIPQTIFYRAKRSAEKRSIEFNITIQYMDTLLKKQKFRCALTHRPLIVIRGMEGNISLDRIDSNKGYVEGNVQWVLKEVNIMKNSYTQQHFIDLCKMIAYHN